MKSLKAMLLATLIFITCNTFAQTTIFVIRHAEKATTPGNDPDLSAEGKARATELAKLLKGQKIAAAFTTPYKRTSQTGEPTLQQAGLGTLQTYDPSKLPEFAKQVLEQYAGKAILIVGHSNTIIPTLQAFGAEKPFETLDDEDYDFLFKITIGADKKVTLDVKRYGVAHHSTKPFPKNRMIMQSN